ncbi:hypothetical protein Tco_0289537 [Tanacetum coccineum]
MVKLTYKLRMQDMVEMATRMQGDKIRIKHLMQEMGMMKAIRFFGVFHELSQIQERKMFSVITKMKKAIMPVIVQNQEFVMQLIMMARIQPANDNGVQKPNYDAKAVSEINALHKMISKGVHELKNHGKHKTVINASDDDQIDSNIIFDDLYVENNG